LTERTGWKLGDVITPTNVRWHTNILINNSHIGHSKQQIINHSITDEGTQEGNNLIHTKL
jgi:hypothetical protein